MKKGNAIQGREAGPRKRGRGWYRGQDSNLHVTKDGGS